MVRVVSVAALIVGMAVAMVGGSSGATTVATESASPARSAAGASATPDQREVRVDAEIVTADADARTARVAVMFDWSGCELAGETIDVSLEDATVEPGGATAPLVPGEIVNVLLEPAPDGSWQAAHVVVLDVD